MGENGALKQLKTHPLNDDPLFSKSIKKLPYKSYREVDRDGNCLYSAFVMLIYPFLRDAEKLEEFLGLGPLLEEAKVDPVVYESYIESIRDIFAVNDGVRGVEDLCSDDWNVFIGYIRMAVSSHVLTNADKYSEFLPDCTVESYVRTQIDPMGERAGEMEIIAVSRLFKYKISIVYLVHDSYKTTSYGEGDLMTILHTPDHFEPMY